MIVIFKPLILAKISSQMTDASNFAVGAVSSRGSIERGKPVSYASRTLTSTGINYSTIGKKLLAIVRATKLFRPYRREGRGYSADDSESSPTINP